MSEDETILNQKDTGDVYLRNLRKNQISELRIFLQSALNAGEESKFLSGIDIVQELLPRKDGWMFLRPFLESTIPTNPSLASACLQLSLDNGNFQVEKFLATPWLNDDAAVTERILQRLHGHDFPDIGDSAFANAFLEAWKFAKEPSNEQLLRVHEIAIFHSFNRETFLRSIEAIKQPAPPLRCVVILIFAALNLYPKTLSFLWELETLPERYHWVVHFYLWNKTGAKQIFHAINILFNGDVFSPMDVSGAPINPENYFHKQILSSIPEIALALGNQLGKLPTKNLQPHFDQILTFVRTLETKWENLRNLEPRQRLFTKMKDWYFLSVYRIFEKLLEANQEMTADLIMALYHILSSIQFARTDSNLQLSVLGRLSDIINAKFSDTIEVFLGEIVEPSSDLSFQEVLVHNRKYFQETFLLQLLPRVLPSVKGSRVLLYSLLSKHFLSSKDGRQFYFHLVQSEFFQEFALQCLPQCINAILSSYPEYLEPEDLNDTVLEIVSSLEDGWKVYVIQLLLQSLPKFQVTEIAKDPKLAVPHQLLISLFDEVSLEYIPTSFDLFVNYFESLPTNEKDLVFAFYWTALLQSNLKSDTKDALVERFLTLKRVKAKL